MYQFDKPPTLGYTYYMDYKQKEEEYNFLSDIIYVLRRSRPPIGERDIQQYTDTRSNVIEAIFHRRDQLEA